MKDLAVMVLGLVLAVVLSACLPRGACFGTPDRQPRPEFPGSPMAPLCEERKE